MPTYEYECQRCGHKFEEFQSITAAPRSRCPVCRGKVQRLIGGGIGIVFKGSGWYATDSRPRRPGGAAESGGGQAGTAAEAAVAAGKGAGKGAGDAAAAPKGEAAPGTDAATARPAKGAEGGAGGRAGGERRGTRRPRPGR